MLVNNFYSSITLTNIFWASVHNNMLYEHLWWVYAVRLSASNVSGTINAPFSFHPVKNTLQVGHTLWVIILYSNTGDSGLTVLAL
jgi:hypothetical protein